MRICIILLLCAFGLNTQAQSKLTRYQRSILGETILSNSLEANGYVLVTYVAPNKAENVTITKPVKVQKYIFDLEERAQKALIESLNSKVASVNELLAGLKSSLTPTSRSSTIYETKKTQFVKKFELDIRDVLASSPRQGRITELYLHLDLPDNNAIKFVGFKNIVTKYEVVDFGKIGLTRNRNFSLNAGLNVAGTGSTTSSDTRTENRKIIIDGDTVGLTDVAVGGDASGITNTSNVGVGLTSGRTLVEEVGLKMRKIAMKGSVGSMRASIYQEGYPAINLNDKISVELIFQSTSNTSELALSFAGLFSGSGTPVTNAADLGISLRYLTLPIANANPIKANLSYEFVYREVKNKRGINSPGEWDDKIEYKKLLDGEIVSSSEDFLSVDELKPDKWALVKSVGGVDHFLWLNYYQDDIQLKFTSIKEVMDLFIWLKQTNSTKFKGFQFKIGATANSAVNLKKQDISLLNPLKM